MVSPNNFKPPEVSPFILFSQFWFLNEPISNSISVILHGTVDEAVRITSKEEIQNSKRHAHPFILSDNRHYTFYLTNLSNVFLLSWHLKFDFGFQIHILQSFLQLAIQLVLRVGSPFITKEKWGICGINSWERVWSIGWLLALLQVFGFESISQKTLGHFGHKTMSKCQNRMFMSKSYFTDLKFDFEKSLQSILSRFWMSYNFNLRNCV